MKAGKRQFVACLIAGLLSVGVCYADDEALVEADAAGGLESPGQPAPQNAVRSELAAEMQQIMADMHNATTAEQLAEIQLRLQQLTEKMGEQAKVAEEAAAPAPKATKPRPASLADRKDELTLDTAVEGDELMTFVFDIPVVVTASRVEEPIDLAPNVMYVITREEIRKYGYHRPLDLLTRIPGFFSLFGTNVNAHLLQVRGVALGENVQIALRINGHRVNSVNEDSSMLWPITLDNVERAEVIVGPGSILYGSDTLLATINLITRDMEGMEVVGSYGFGDFNNDDRGVYRGEEANCSQSYSGTIMGGKRWDDDKKAFGSATYARKPDGFYTKWLQDTETPAGPYDRLDPSYFLFGNAEIGDWYFQVSSLNQEIGNVDKNDGFNGRAHYVDSVVVRNKHNYNENFATLFEFSYDRKRYIRSAGWWFDHTLMMYSGEVGIQWKTDRNFLQAGVQFTYNDHKENYFINGYPPTAPMQNKNAQRFLLPENTNVIGAYISDKFQVTDKLALVGALRIDRSSITDPNHAYISPRAAIIYQPIKEWVLKLMYNTAIKYPEPYATSTLAIWRNRELGYTSGPLSGLAKVPETLAAFEIQSIHYIGKSRLSGSFYWQKVSDLTGWSGGWTTLGDFKGIGAEVDFRAPITDWLNIWANAAWEDTEFEVADPSFTGIVYDTPDGAMNQVPKLMANVGADAQLTKDISIAATCRYITEVPWQSDWKDGSYQPGLSYWNATRNQVFFDASFLWQNFLIENLDVRLSGKNIFNNRAKLPRQREKGIGAPEGATVELTVWYKW